MIDYEKKFEEENKDTITDRSLGEYYQRFKFWLKSQLLAKDKEIAELKAELQQRTKERDNHFRDIIKLENELSELKVENEQLLGLDEISAYDIGMFKRMKDELETHRAVMAEGIPVDIAYTGSANIITNLPNALYGKFILIRLNEKGDK